MINSLYVHAAQCSNPPCDLSDLLVTIRDLINMIIPMLFAVAVLLFLWGIVNFIFINQDSPEKREDGKRFMIWGIVALFVMVSFWGFVNILSNTFFGASPANLGDNIQEIDVSDN